MNTNNSKKIFTEATITPVINFPVVGIGASAGGLDAFKKLLSAIPEHTDMAWILLQHLDASYESKLAELLQKITQLPVISISDRITVLPNHIYIIPANKILLVKNGKLKVSPRPSKKNTVIYMPIDVFFTSLAEVYETHAIGVVLSGTASDGTKGLKAIKDHGGITIAQSIATAVYDSMPLNAIASGMVDFILAPEKIPGHLQKIAKNFLKNSIDQETGDEEESFKKILGILLLRKGTDFTYYKQSTIRRRIMRRMVLNKFSTTADYLDYLRENLPEQDALYQDMLIPVTSFFRDTKVFNNLCESVFPSLIKNKTADGHIRIWVAGCSTGEEAYSIAICFKEYLGHKKEKLQIFATDLSETAITKARAGVYTKTEAESVSAGRLKENFTLSQGSYRVNKDLRDICVFATHNFIKDPPFSRIDFISCRNVLIYMDTYLQKKALTTFHYALNARGLLMLGKSENTIGVTDLFIANGKNEKIFTRKDVASMMSTDTTRQIERHKPGEKYKIKPQRIRTDFQKIVDDIILKEFTSAAVVVTDTMDIVHFRGSTVLYLRQDTGKPNHNLLKMARPELSFELRNLLNKVKKEKISVKKENILLPENGLQHIINISAFPLPDSIEQHYVVLFHQAAIYPVKDTTKKADKYKKDEQALRIQQLENELELIREDMRIISDDQESSNEELQSTNEELLSGNEELQSLNDELETSKEELQSTIEELTVVNQEMVNLNEQLAIEKNYAEAIIATIPQPMLVLDKNLRVKIANERFYKKFLVKEEDTEGRLIYDFGSRQWDIPGLKILLETILPEKKSCIGFEVEHTFKSIGTRTMLLNAREIVNEKEERLILLAIEDITDQRVALRKLEESSEQFSSMADNIPQLAWMADGKGWIYWYNKRWYDYTGTNLNEMQGWGWQKVHHPDHMDRVVNFVTEAWTKNEPFELTFPLRSAQGEYKWFLTRAQPITNDKGKIIRWFGSNTDITEQRKVQSLLEYRKALLEAHNESSVDGILLADEKGKIISFNKRYIEIWQIPQQLIDAIDDEAIIAHTLSMLLNPEELVEKNKYIYSYPLETGSILLQFKDGKIVERHNYPVIGDNGNFYGVSLRYTDITEQKSAQSLLEYRKALLEAHNESSVDGILLVDAKGNIITYNKRFIEIWNMPQSIVDAKDDEAALQFAMAQLVHPDQFIEKVKWLYENPDETSTDMLEYKDGKIVERHGYPVIAKDGSYYAWSWTFRDITELRNAELALQKSEQHFRQLADLIPEKITTSDPSGNINYFNKNWMDFTGLSFDELVNMGWNNAIHPDELEEVVRQWQQAIKTGTDLEIELRMKNKNGEFIWHLARARAIKDEAGKVIKWIGSITEIQKIKEEEQRKEDFLKMVSHELKTPVTSIKGYVQLLLSMLNEQETIPATPLETSLKRIDSQVLRLTRLITEMLDLSRIEAGKLELQRKEFSLNDLVAETVLDVLHTSPTHTIDVQNNLQCIVEGDKDRIGQVLINFLNNGIKYSPANNKIEVNIYASIDNQVAVSVKDFGIGINKQDQQKIFERFYRVGGESELSYAGFGIGLFIANEIIERHAGFIRVESEVEKGSTFTFYLPVKKIITLNQ